MRLIDADALSDSLEQMIEMADIKSWEYIKEPVVAHHYEMLKQQIEEILTGISGLPTIESAQPEPHWIPCSERLPELDDEVLVTDDGGELRHCIFCTWGETWCGFITYEEGMRIIAVAWMPLPPVYKGE